VQQLYEIGSLHVRGMQSRGTQSRPLIERNASDVIAFCFQHALTCDGATQRQALVGGECRRAIDLNHSLRQTKRSWLQTWFQSSRNRMVV